MRATVALDATSFRPPRQEQGQDSGHRHVVDLAEAEQSGDQGLEFRSVFETMPILRRHSRSRPDARRLSRPRHGSLDKSGRPLIVVELVRPLVVGVNATA